MNHPKSLLNSTPTPWPAPIWRCAEVSPRLDRSNCPCHFSPAPEFRGCFLAHEYTCSRYIIRHQRDSTMPPCTATATIVNVDQLETLPLSISHHFLVSTSILSINSGKGTIFLSFALVSPRNLARNTPSDDFLRACCRVMNACFRLSNAISSSRYSCVTERPPDFFKSASSSEDASSQSYQLIISSKSNIAQIDDHAAPIA